MDKASVYGTGDCRFESYQGHFVSWSGAVVVVLVYTGAVYLLAFHTVTCPCARLAQLVERQPFKLVVVGSSPTVGSVVFLSVLLFECSGCICCCVIAVDTQAPWPNG